MITDKDLVKIGQVVDSSLDNKLGVVERNFDSKLASAEERLIVRFRQELVNSERRIVSDVGNFVNDSLLPQIDEQTKRLDTLEALPAISHQIKSKK